MKNFKCNGTAYLKFKDGTSLEVSNVSINMELAYDTLFYNGIHLGDYLINREIQVTGGIAHISASWIDPKTLVKLSKVDVFKDRTNNWRKMHGLPMRRRK